MSHGRNPFANARVEHTCLPSTEPKATADFLVTLGGHIVMNNPSGAVFCLFAGHLYEFNTCRTAESPNPDHCHIACGFETVDEFTKVVNYSRDELSGTVNLIYNHDNDDLKYVLVRIPGGVTLQIIWRAEALI